MTMDAPSPDAVRVGMLVAWYETLSPDTLARAKEFYAQDAYFRDPFNEVRGVGAIVAIFEHMFRSLQEPRFRVSGVFDGGAQLMLTWDFEFRMARRSYCIQGASRLRFAADGLIIEHVDYWDAASGFMAQLPLVGAGVRWLLRRLAAPSTRDSVEKR